MTEGERKKLIEIKYELQKLLKSLDNLLKIYKTGITRNYG